MASYYESAYKQLLLGVSQQDPKDRLDGQLSAQTNMVSDLVYGLRRRSPIRYAGALPYNWANAGIAVYSTRVGGSLLFVAVSIVDGVVRAIQPDGTIKWTLTDTYLQASSKAAIRFATVGEEIYIANVERVPTEVTPDDVADYPDPTHGGYWFGVATAYSKTFDLTVTNRNTGDKTTVSYTTPQGTTAAEVAQATLEYVATQLAASLTTALPGLTVTRDGGYVGIWSPDYPISVTTSSGSTFAKASGTAQTTLVDNLPALLPGSALDNFIMTVGTGDSATYYRYSASDSAWYEDAAYGSMQRPTNMPVRLRIGDDGSTWELTQPEYERRAAGNADTNPSAHFVDVGITGISAFQGRLVLLSNEYVCMSATNKPLRWYRSTTESLVASDVIEAAGSDASSSAYVYAQVFNKDLVCFGADVQAVVPGSAPVTPSNVVVAVMSRYRFTLYAPPVVTGRSMYVGASRGDGYAAVWEVLPSEYVSSQIVADDSTAHLPGYCAGTINLLAASSTSGILVAGYTGEPNTLLIEEYSWVGTEKRQAAWHKWVLPGSLIHATFEGDVLYLLLNTNYRTVVCSIDLRAGAGPASTQVPRLDYYLGATCTVAEQISVPTAYYTLIASAPLAFKTQGSNPYLSQTVSVLSQDTDTTVLRVVGAAVDDVYVLGRRYTSSFTLSPPQLRDQSDVPISMHKSIIQRYHIRWNYTGTFKYTFADKYRAQPALDGTPLTFTSPELVLGSPLVASGRTVLPARLDMLTVEASFSTDDVFDLNPVSVEYGYRYNQPKGRRA